MRITDTARMIDVSNSRKIKVLCVLLRKTITVDRTNYKEKYTSSYYNRTLLSDISFRVVGYEILVDDICIDCYLNQVNWQKQNLEGNMVPSMCDE